MRLPQMTTRRWMLAVAAVALLLGAQMMARRYGLLQVFLVHVK
jgi:hypothetical protein